MQIHFYDKWDKQSSKKSESRSQQSFIYPQRFVNKLKSIDGSKANLILIAIAVTTAFIFSYLIFAGEQGQAVSNTMEERIVKPNGILYTVQKGDTLWTIAGQYYPELSRNEAIIHIQQKNGFQGTAIHAGQTILLP